MAQEQRVWVITGANSGLGHAIASAVLSKGDKVIATVRSLDRLPVILREQGAHPLELDLTSSDDDISRVAQNALGVYGTVDVLVNSAGCCTPSPWEEADMSEVRTQFQTLFFGTVAFTQAFLPHFRTRRTGHILNISSIGSFLAPPSWGAYASAKAALNIFSDTLHQEMKAFGVQVLTIVPGYFLTQFMPTVNEKQRLSEVYTCPVTQGYNLAKTFHEFSHDAGQFGDPEKLAARLFELVTGTGLAEGLVLNREGRFDWTLVPLGSDCEVAVKEKLQTMLENVNGTEPIWRSTSMDAESARLVPRDLDAFHSVSMKSSL